jgi:DNA-directed RNA polymerase specialized sigma24 family protein
MRVNESASSWPGMDERGIVEEMLHDPTSYHWQEYYKLVQRYVYAKTETLPSNLQDDIIQEVMYKVAKYLPRFRFRCVLKKWLNQVVEGCIIDARRWQNKGQPCPPLDIIDPLNEDESFYGEVGKSAEDMYETSDETRNRVMALLEYVNIHPNSVRNRLIIRWSSLKGELIRKQRKKWVVVLLL